MIIGEGLLWVALGLVLLIKGADYLIDGAAKGAIKLGVSELIVGLTVIAFGTSAPELFVSVQATMEGQSGIALGNVIGSNICNITLILGFAAVMSTEANPIKFSKMAIKRDFPAVILTSAILVYFLINSSGIEAKEGQILLLFLFMYLFFVFKEASENKADANSSEATADLPDTQEAKSTKWLSISLMIIGGLAGLAVGSNRLVHGAVQIATALNVDETIIGLSVVALGTSLPELATVYAAVKKNQTDMIVGGILGSNLFNVLSVVGISSLFGQLENKGISPENDLVPMMVLSVLIFLKILPKPNELPKSFGILLLLGYAGYIFVRFF